MDPLIGSAIVSGISALLGSALNTGMSNEQVNAMIKSNQAMNSQNVAAQREINAANVRSAEEINQQQIGFQREINDLMRYDSKHSISDKKQDLIRAGYSTADPSLQGFSAASLGGISPVMATQQAPVVSSEYDSSIAAHSLNSRNSTINNILSIARTASDIALQKAQTRSANAGATGQEIDNAWKELEHKANLRQTYENISNLVKDGKVKDATAAQILKNIDVLDQQVETMKESLKQIKFTTEHQEEQFYASIANLIAQTNDLIASKGLKYSQRDFTELQSAYQRIVNDFADYGINFNDNSIFASIIKLAHKGHSGDLVRDTLSSIVDIFKSIFVSSYDSEPDLNTVKSKVLKMIESSRRDQIFGAAPYS